MINISMPEQDSLMKPRIVVFGVGGAGSNAINNMIRSGLEGTEFVAANTDAQALSNNLAPKKLQLGVTVTRGLGAGARPDVGRESAEEQMDEISGILDGAHMVFITAGMGGGTGTGAAPVIARAARERGILTVGVVTKPFHFEGAVRMRSAEAGIDALQQYVDTLIVIPNQQLFNIANEKTGWNEAFKLADDVLYQGVRGVTDLIMTPGQINLDFADIRSVMSEMGKAMMGSGEAEGENRARQAAEMAINNPLLEDATVKGARGVLINITGGPDLTLFEVEEAADRIREEVDPDANIIFGTAMDESMKGRMRISVVATGIDAATQRKRPPLTVVGGDSASAGKLTVTTSNVSLTAPFRRGHEEVPAGDWIVVEVADTGTGIPPEIMDRIFDPFFSTKEVGKGTGLGLSTCYGIVKQTGGYVFVDSEMGRGTTFSIYLPRHVKTAADEEGREKAAQNDAQDLTGAGVILLVEDEDAVRMFASRALKNKGYTVLEARHGEHALEVIAEHNGRIDLVVSDVMMPGMDGPTMLRHIREQRPTLKAIFISGYSEERLKETFETSDDIYFLPKPFSLKQLAEKVKEVL